jgi:hypothetical protein
MGHGKSPLAVGPVLVAAGACGGGATRTLSAHRVERAEQTFVAKALPTAAPADHGPPAAPPPTVIVVVPPTPTTTRAPFTFPQSTQNPEGNRPPLYRPLSCGPT